MLSLFFTSPTLLLAGNPDAGGAFLVFAFLIGIVPFLGFFFYEEFRKHQFKQLWSGFAKALSGSYNQEHDIGEIKARVQGTQITINTETPPGGSSFKSLTRVSTPLHGSNDFTLSLSLEGVMTSLGKAFGTQDIILGEQAFDHKFIVKSNNELLCRLWLNAMIRPMLLLLETYTLSIEKGEIVLRKATIEKDLARLKHAVEVCAKLGKQLPKISENWLSLAKRFEARFKSVKSSNPLPHNTQLEFEHQGCRYNIEIVSTQHAGIQTKITAEKPSAIGLFSIAPADQPALADTHELHLPLMPKQYRVFANNEEDATHTISEGVIQAIQKLTPYSIAATQHNLEIILPGFVYAHEPIKAALDLADTFVSQHQGPYR